MKISDLNSENNNVSLKLKVLSVDKREIKSEEKSKIYYYGLVGDETGVIPFTAWEFPDVIKSGDVIEVKYAHLKEYRGKFRLYFDSRTEIMVKPGENIEIKNTYKDLKIKDLNPVTPFVTVSGKVTNVTKRENDKTGTIYSGYIEDDTGRVRFSSFGVPLENNRFYRIEGARVSMYSNRIEITVSNKSVVKEIESDMNLERNYKIFDIKNPVGGINIMGFIITLGEKSGIIKRCSVCNKTISLNVCPDHPDAGINLDIFAYFTIDDGTGFVRATAGKDAILPLININENEIARKASIIYNEMYKKLYGHAFKFTGNFIKKDDELDFQVIKANSITDDEIKIEMVEMENELS
ncbi:replication protein A [Picrophilus oshimae]|nr:replication protein A [Picrophilus oshimae]AAT44004.1 replication factor-A protein 1 [Picrophilus oshimae DSM 9789]